MEMSKEGKDECLCKLNSKNNQVLSSQYIVYNWIKVGQWRERSERRNKLIIVYAMNLAN